MARNGFGLASLATIVMMTACSSGDGDGGGATADSAVVDGAVDDAPKADTTATDSTASDAPATDSAATDSTASDSTASDSPPSEAGACGLAAPACNSLTMPASATLVTGTVGTIPTFTAGGAIPDGSYVLVKEVLESGTPKPTKQVARVTGTCLEGFSIDATGKEVRATGSGSFVTGDFTFTCPIAFTQHSSYGSADGGGGKVKLITVSDPSLGPKTYREWIQQ